MDLDNLNNPKNKNFNKFTFKRIHFYKTYVHGKS